LEFRLSESTSPNRGIIGVRKVTHRYGQQVALDGLDLDVFEGEILGLLGPNGSGKSTLFRLISTLVPLQEGKIHVCGLCCTTQKALVRRQLGVVFQSPSLDRKLTVLENMQCQAALSGLVGVDRDQRIRTWLQTLGLSNLVSKRCEKLSGGQKRRVELAKGLLHQPKVLLLDEPSTGLDPMARLELWQALQELRNQHGTTVVLTTHLLEEADKCDRLGILCEGKLVGCDSPENLRTQTGEMRVVVQATDPQAMARHIGERLGMQGMIVGDQIRFQDPIALQRLNDFVQLAKDQGANLSVGRPSLEDVFIARTGRSFHHS
jgi:ABC-2 type transport system ATP-binding protein